MTSRSTSLLALTAAFLSLSSPAFAADTYTPPDAYAQPASSAPAHSWTGLWLGAVGGMSFFNTETDYTHDFVPEEAPVVNRGFVNIDGLGAEGLFGEIQAGYDKQIGQRTVIGIFGGLNMTDAEFSASAGGGDEIVASVAADYDWGSVLGVRAGILKSQSTLFYVAGGWAHAELGDVTGAVEGEAFTVGGPTLDGYFGEIGMETEVSDNVYLTVAGRYTDYGKETLWSNGDPICPEEITVDTDTLSAMVGLKVKLGGVGF